MKIITIVGARPQFIKEAVIGKALRIQGVEEILIHTGQHYDSNMSDIFFKQLQMKKPDYNLEIGSGSHAYQTGTAMIRIEEIAEKERPDAIVVFGDTNATIAGAITGAKLKIPVGHVEAGLRQEPKDMPEEINRVVTDHVSQWLFCPSQKSIENLKREGLEKKGYFVGDVMFDLFKEMEPFFDPDKVMAAQKIEENEFILMTVHRDFNTDKADRFENILKAITEISKDTKVIFPVHPRTKKIINSSYLDNFPRNIKLIDPIPYLEMMGLLKKCKYVITDSGGLQKEAYFAGKRAIVLMPDTGWYELIESGWNILTDADTEKTKIASQEITKEFIRVGNLYGNGNSGELTTKILLGIN